MREFEGKTAIVTGATSGMGKGIARALYAKGANLILTGRNAQRGETLVKELGNRAVFEEGDIKLPEVNESLVNRALKEFGSVDKLVLCAGQLGIGKVDELSIEDWNDTIATNLNAVFYLLKYALPHMKKEGASIVVIGSVAAFHAFPNHPAYTAAKGALPALIKQVALDYGPQVRVNMISPAQVETPLLNDSVKAFENPDRILQETAERLPMKRLGTTDDIANAVLYLLSDAASWVTGTNLTVDGGFMAT